MHYTKLFYYSESVSKVVLFQNFNFSLLSVYGLVHGQNLLYKARTRKSISWLLIGKWILYRWRPSKIKHRTFRFHFTICIDYTLVLWTLSKCSYRLLLREQFDLETIVLNSHTCNWYWLDELIADKISWMLNPPM